MSLQYTTPPHWDEPEIPFYDEQGTEFDLFGPVGTPLDPTLRGITWQYSANPNDTIYLTLQLVKTLRECINVEDAMGQFRAFIWARRSNSPTAVLTEASRLEDFLTINNGREELNPPTLDAGFAFVWYNEDWHGVAFSCIGGTYIPVDFAEAARAVIVTGFGLPWMTLALAMAPYHPVINAFGGFSGPLFNAPFRLYGMGETRTTYGYKAGQEASPVNHRFVDAQWEALVLGQAAVLEQHGPMDTDLDLVCDTIERAIRYAKAKGGLFIQKGIPDGVFCFGPTDHYHPGDSGQHHDNFPYVDLMEFENGLSGATE